ncbi:MAG: hypothetical protein JXR03_20315 [Cyclobacteriaceae bacterium]
METVELKRIWNTLAEEKLIDKNLARENIKQIITQKGNGVIGKLQRKHRLDISVYAGIAIVIPLVILLLLYRDSQDLVPKTSFGLGGPYLVPILIEAFIIYALMSLKRNLNFIKQTYNTGTLLESLLNVKSYFQKITKKGFWIGSISMIAILGIVEVDTLMKIGWGKSLNLSFGGSYIFESYFSIFLIILIIAIPFIVRKDAKKYASVLGDLDGAIEELNQEA